MRIDKNTTIKLGNRNIVKIKNGNVVIWEKSSGPVVEPEYFYIESLTDGNTVRLNTSLNDTSHSQYLTPTVQFSTDKQNWTTVTFDWSATGGKNIDISTVLNTGDKMYFRNDTGKFSYVKNGSPSRISFSTNRNANVGGDIRTLSNYRDVETNSMTQGMFSYLFKDNTHIVDASNLRLPYITLENYCYENMFDGCTSLTTAPALPATTLAQYCYQSMFQNCTSLTTAPALPATTLAQYCYQSMFQNCTSLTTAPALPATTLAYGCYQYMFSGCTSLTSAPSLPATTLAQSCYNTMFQDCTSLTTAPALPATTLAQYCYQSMFQNCTSLTTAPALPATTLASNCYDWMFYGCSSLNKILVYANSGTTSGNINDWLNGVAASGTFYNAGGETYTQDSASGIPTGWTEVTTVPTTTSVYAVPDTFSAKSWMDKAKLNYTIMGVNETGIDVPLSNETVRLQIGKNTGSSTRTITQTYSYDGMDYTITINQSANDTDEPNYFYIEGNENDVVTVKVKFGSSSTGGNTETFEYSTDKDNWTLVNVVDNLTESITIPSTGKVYFRNDTGKFATAFANTSNYVDIKFDSSDNYIVGGDITTLLDYRNGNVQYTSGCFQSLFLTSTKLTDASNLILSDKTYNYCYQYMFSGCSSLTSAPALPATTLASNCYRYMFRDCTSLVNAPALPATTLVSYCYGNMFEGCTSLTTAPSLPATTLAQYCYDHMFQNCTSLTTAPALPATSLTQYCYQQMFRGCTSLTTAPALPATTLASNCYSNMFNGCSSLTSVTIYATTTALGAFSSWLNDVAASGTFNNAGFLELPENSASGIPTGWTEILPIQSITANPDTFTLKSYQTKVKCESTLTITTTLGTTVTKTNSAVVTVGENTGDSTRTLTETIPYKGSSYQVTIVQTANDVKPVVSWNVVSTGTYPFQLNSNNYYESTNKGHDNSYSYATLNYSGFDELVLECINFAESNYDYGIISQPDVQLSESITDDGATGSANVFHNFKGEQSANPVQLTIPSDGGSHFITIKFRKDSSQAKDNDSLQFTVIEP